jgi:RNA polymerase sigma-70 factor (ECF subfamily)
MSPRSGDPPESPPSSGSPRTPEGIAAHRPYHHLIRRIVRAKGVPEPDAEDAQQDVLMAAIEADRSGNVRSMRGLISAIALRWVADYCRAKGKRGPVLEHDDSRPAPDAEESFPEPDLFAVRKERVKALHAILEQMEPDLRDVFILIDIEELGGKEAAAILEIDVAALRQRIRRARERFAELIGPFRAKLRRGGYL